MGALAKIKNRISGNRAVSVFMLALLVLQPFLDVLSYFLMEIEKTTYTTILRMLMFAAIMLYSFCISDKKKVYYIFAAVAGGYYVLHAANCFRIGYISPFEDVANFLRTVQTPALAIAFITLFKRTENPGKIIGKSFLCNVFIVWCVIGLSYLCGKPEYTYSQINAGLLGWFGIANAQSVIVMLLMPLTLYFAYRLGNIMFVVASIACFSLLFCTGTQLTFYSIFILAAGFLLLLFINFFTTDLPHKKYALKNVIPAAVLVAAVVLTAVFVEHSPMYYRLSTQHNAYNQHQSSVSENMAELSSDLSSEISSNVSSEPNSVPDKEQDSITIEQYEKIYRSVANGFLSDMIDRYGIERVAKKYNYTQDTYILLDARLKKSNFAQLAWEESDILTRCVGFEYMTLITDKEIYDLENDFPALFYSLGYIGSALYAGFILYFIYLIIRQLFVNFKRLFSIESGLLCITLCLIFGAALYTGYVMRRPNVSIYLSIVLAYAYLMYKKESDQGVGSQSKRHNSRI